MSMYNPRQGGDPEMVIQQAMRAMAGGRRGEVGRSSQSGGGRPSRFARWTVTQILLLAAIIGLVLGMGAAFVVLLTR
jgi:hypothetical protein